MAQHLRGREVNSLRHCPGCAGEFFANELDGFGWCEDCAPSNDVDATDAEEEDDVA